MGNLIKKNAIRVCWLILCFTVYQSELSAAGPELCSLETSRLSGALSSAFANARLVGCVVCSSDDIDSSTRLIELLGEVPKTYFVGFMILEETTVFDSEVRLQVEIHLPNHLLIPAGLTISPHVEQKVIPLAFQIRDNPGLRRRIGQLLEDERPLKVDVNDLKFFLRSDFAN